MKTSYFFSNKLTKEDNLVSISISPPKKIMEKLPNIYIYSKLCPSWNLVQSYKLGKINEQRYVELYSSIILNKLSARTVYDELRSDAILLCWERPEKFCHRHIVANWLSTILEIKIEEL